MAGNTLRLQVLLAAIDRASGPLKRIMGGSAATSKALRTTQGELKRLEGVQRDITGFRKLETQLGTTRQQLQLAERELRRMTDAVNAADAPTAEQTAALRKQAEALGNAELQQRLELGRSRKALEAVGIDTARLAVHERTLQADIGKANQAIEEQRRRLSRLAAAQQKMQRMHSAGMKLAAHGAGAVAAGTVAARGIGAPVAAFAAQEDAATQLRASMMGANGQVAAEFAQIDALAQRLGNRLPGTTADFYEMMTMLRRQGMSAKVILGGLGEATGYLGVQLNMGYSEAAEFAAKLQDATRTSERDMMALSDVIQRTFYLGVDADNMLQGFSKLTSSMDVLKRTWVRLAFVEAGSDWRSLNRLAIDDGYLRDYLIVPDYHRGYLGVQRWADSSGTVAGSSLPSNGAFSVADPRAAAGAAQYQQYGVMRMTDTAGAVIGVKSPGQGTFSVADPRCNGERHKNAYRIVRADGVAGTVTGDFRPAGGGGVADPRAAGGFAGAGKYQVSRYGEPAGTVIARSDTGHGAYAVADPRPANQRQVGDAYLTNGHYGVVGWNGSSGAVSAAAGHDNGRWSVADPRLPGERESVTCVIRSMDGTWHRPFTTLELAALQSLVDPEEKLELDGLSDQAWRERIGNAVPPAAAQAIGEEIGRTLLLAWTGQTFALGATPIWVRDLAMAMTLPGGGASDPAPDSPPGDAAAMRGRSCGSPLPRSPRDARRRRALHRVPLPTHRQARRTRRRFGRMVPPQSEAPAACAPPRPGSVNGAGVAGG